MNKKPLKLFVLLLGILACSKQNDDNLTVTSLDQLRGEWEWVSTCGGLTPDCTYSSASNHAEILFSLNGIFVEKHNDTICQQTHYTVIKINETSGTLILDNKEYQSPIRIVNNQLEIRRGELADTYKKIK
jgi:hypothetical protein